MTGSDHYIEGHATLKTWMRMIQRSVTADLQNGRSRSSGLRICMVRGRLRVQREGKPMPCDVRLKPVGAVLVKNATSEEASEVWGVQIREKWSWEAT